MLGIAESVLGIAKHFWEMLGVCWELLGVPGIGGHCYEVLGKLLRTDGRCWEVLGVWNCLQLLGVAWNCCGVL